LKEVSIVIFCGTYGKGESTSCVPRSKNCITCVPRCPLHVYQLRPAVSASRVSVASRGVRFTCISCVPRCPLHVYQLRPELSNPDLTSCFPQIEKNCIDATEQNVQKLEGSYTVLLYFTLYIITCTHTELLNDIDNTFVILCYCLMFKPCKKKLFWEEDRHITFLISPISSYCYDLIKTLSPERVLIQ
jgi:hypothetical protein